jgi:hypothetical protein
MVRYPHQLRDRQSAAVLYGYLEPFAGQVAMVANMVGSYGSFAWPCGMLAAVLEKWDDAERHFNTALAMNERIGARPWLVRTRRSYAEMLLDRDDPSRPGDRACAAELIAAAPRLSSSAWRARSSASNACRHGSPRRRRNVESTCSPRSNGGYDLALA